MGEDTTTAEVKTFIGEAETPEDAVSKATKAASDYLHNHVAVGDASTSLATFTQARRFDDEVYQQVYFVFTITLIVEENNE